MLGPYFLPIYVCLVVQLFHFLYFYLVVYRQVLPEAKEYMDRRERQRILEE